MRIPSVFLVLSLALASAPATAKWVNLSTSSEFHLYGNTDGRTATRAWFDYQHIEPQVQPWGLEQSQRFLTEVSCREGKYRALQATAYDPKGRMLASDSVPGNWKYVIPGTLGEYMQNFICKRQPQ